MLQIFPRLFQVKMLIQSSLCSSIGTTPFNLSECENSVVVYDLASRTETCQMFLKFPEHSQGSCQEAIPVTDREPDDSCHLNLRRICSKQSTINKAPKTAPPTQVYHRRKRGRKSTASSAEHASGKTKRGGDCGSVISSDIAFPVADEVQLGIFQETDTMNSKNKNEFSAAQVCAADGMLKNCMPKTRDADSANDSCSSSKSNVEFALVSMRTGVDEASECSSSGEIAVEEDLSAKDFCISILRKYGLLEGAWRTGTISSVEDMGIDGGSSCSRSCKICSQPETIANMLICDDCEEVFHTNCCNVPLEKVPHDDEWLCPSCLKKKQFNKKNSRKPTKIANRRSYGNSFSRSKVNAIALMLTDTAPYTTGVRIGKNFQAEVPEWSGPTISNASYMGEPLEGDPSECTHEKNANKPYKLSSIWNWLQCREEGVDGTICGKWRRAPLFEEQTDDWECYCCLFWDPSHADCAVPQELGTDEILKQLKYIELLRPRLAAKRRKFEGANSDDGSQHSQEGTRNKS